MADKNKLRKWVHALRSGNYAQGTKYLNKDNRLCCLGVLAEVCKFPKNLGESPYVHYKINNNLCSTILPQEFLEALGLTPVFVNALMSLNDGGEWSFKQIAALVEEVYELHND